MYYYLQITLHCYESLIARYVIDRQTILLNLILLCYKFYSGKVEKQNMKKIFELIK